ncbi:MAG: hypothetical protein HY922_02280 [Elusimicrobia bacterium]|nr:hypothetical protein [Elusimicrobiota bacterium]
MKALTKLLAALLAFVVGVQPAAAQVQSIRVEAPSVQSVPVKIGGALGARTGLQSLPLQSLSLGSLLSALPSVSNLKVAQVHAAPIAQAQGLIKPVMAVEAHVKSDNARLVALKISETGRPLRTLGGGISSPEGSVTLPRDSARPPAESSKSFLEKKVQPMAEAVSEAGKGLKEAPEDGASAAAGRQFDLLTGEVAREGSAVSDPVPAQDAALSGNAEAGLEPASEAAQASEKADASNLPNDIGSIRPEHPYGVVSGRAKLTDSGCLVRPNTRRSEGLDVPPAKTRMTEVFKDPERNKSFWRYAAATIVYYFGIEMYIVGLPFVVSSYTKNVLRDNNDARFRNAELLKAAIRENRSVARIAHWVSQAFSYASTPLFTRGAESNPKKWLVRSAFIRAGILALIPTAFFLSGVMSMSAALLTLFALIGVQSFFQGLFVTMDMGASTKIMGDKSVTPAERMKANSILTFIAAATAIIGPAVAGQIAQVKELFGKMEVGGALIYGVYAIATGLAGLLYATVGIIGGKLKKEGDAAAQAAQAPAKAPLSFKSVIKDLASSLKDGIKIIVKNRFLRTMTALTLVYSLFSDPLIFNVLPEYVESVLMANTGAVNAVLGVPVLGWLFKGLMSTPMGYFSMLVVSSSVGSIIGTLLLNPMRRLFTQLGFKTEEALSIPFFILAALEIPLFWIMISAPSMWAILGLYGLQTLVTSFGAMIVGGLHQKTLGNMPDGNVNKVLAAESFLGIIAAILSTYLYGFVLGDIPIRTALSIAAVAATVYGAMRAAAPWLFFTKAERNPSKDAPIPENSKI